jgi:predicted nucleic acid-binding protein
MTIVVDASVAVKWLLPEAGSPAAAALRDQDPSLTAPSLIAAEIGNAVWKAVRSGKVQRSEALAGIGAVLGWFESLIPIELLCVRALELAIALRHPIYDCFYLALAERDNAPLATADEAMIAAARKLKIKVQRI